ncbi:potassium channel family protein [bacterium]|nr:potassium channel family protein [bacterium]
MKQSRIRKIWEHGLRLFWDERAQIAETFSLFTILLFSFAVILLVFGLVYYLVQIGLGTPRTLVECLYFVWITFATIGYSDEGFAGTQIIRLVTILIGAFLLTRYIVLSAHIYARFVVDEVFNRKQIERMKRRVSRSSGHLLIFGDDHELINKIIQGLGGSHDFFLVSDDRKLVTAFRERYKDLKYIPEKPFSTETVDLLRPEVAAGAYTLFKDDEKNILLGAMLENRVRVISSFSGDPSVLPRFKRIGVEPIAPHLMSGLKIVSTLIRPHVTEFLDRFVFPNDSALEFRLRAPDEPHGGIILATVQNGQMDFSAREYAGLECLTLERREGECSDPLPARMEAVWMPCRSDRFLVLGGGTIGKAVIAEILATRRELTLVEPDASKIEQLRRLHGDTATHWVVGNGDPENYRMDEYDGVAIVTPADEINFAIGLDFVGTTVHRVVRAVDDDMEQHYHRIGAVPVFVGRVGAARMLREVTSRLTNRVLSGMIHQQHRLDQVCLAHQSSAAEISSQFNVRILGLCREGICRLLQEPEEQFHPGDTLIVCGQVDDNKRLRMRHRLDGLA